MKRRNKSKWFNYLAGILLVLTGVLSLFICTLKSYIPFISIHSPLILYSGGDREEAENAVYDCIVMHVPLYEFLSDSYLKKVSVQDTMTAERIILLEGSDEDQQEMSETAILPDGLWEKILSGQKEPIQNMNRNANNSYMSNVTDSEIALKMQEENENAITKLKAQENGDNSSTSVGNNQSNDNQSDLEKDSNLDNGIDETEDSLREPGDVNSSDIDMTNLNPTPVVNLDMASYLDFDTLLKEMYVVDKTTYIDSTELDARKMLNEDLTIEKTSDGPQILIYHTHSQEEYADSIPGDMSTTVVGAGDKLAKILTEQYGYNVLHHKGQYDVKNRDYAYANVVSDLEQILKDNPSIEVIIDLHRDGVNNGVHLVSDYNGKQTAQFMFFNGLSRTRKAGEIAYLNNENRFGNLAFSFQLQIKSMQYYPGLVRKIYLKGYRYNMQYRARSLLVELGAQTNTLEEVDNAIPPLAHVISMVLQKQE